MGHTDIETLQGPECGAIPLDASTKFGEFPHV